MTNDPAEIAEQLKRLPEVFEKIAPAPWIHDDGSIIPPENIDCSDSEWGMQAWIAQVNIALQGVGDPYEEFICTMRTLGPVLLGMIEEALEWTNLAEESDLLSLRKQWLRNALARDDVKRWTGGE